MGAVVLVIVAMIAANPRGRADRCGGTGESGRAPRLCVVMIWRRLGTRSGGDRDLWDEVFACRIW